MDNHPWPFKGSGTAEATPDGRGELEFSGTCANWGALGRQLADLLKGEERFSVISGASSGDIVGLETSAAAVWVLALQNHGPL